MLSLLLHSFEDLRRLLRVAAAAAMRQPLEPPWFLSMAQMLSKSEPDFTALSQNGYGTHMYIYIYMCVYIYMYIYICICIYI